MGPYKATCARAVIGGAELYRWLNALCNPGDIVWTKKPPDWDEILSPSPGNLLAGYKSGDILQLAPDCLQSETLDVHKEKFKTAWGVCEFNSTDWSFIMGSTPPNVSSSDSTWLDTQCFCNSLTKLPLDCSSGLDPTKELLWWNATCGYKPSLFPEKNWEDGLIVSNDSYANSISLPSCVEVSANCSENLGTIQAKCTSERCFVDSDGFCSSTGTYLEQDEFCGLAHYKKTCPNACTTGLGPTENLLWWNSTCGDQDLPNNWKDLLIVGLPSNAYLNGSIEAPSCAASQDSCNNYIISLQDKCSSTRCILDADDQCTSNATFLNQECFCAPLGFDTGCPGACPGACKAWDEQQTFRSWVFNECRNLTGWGGLHYSQLDSNGVVWIANDFIPWDWRVKPDQCPNGLEADYQCPSNAAKLGSFAAANAAMLIAVPLIGRRTFINKITMGLFGRADSKFWTTSAIIVVLLHLLGNLINAALVRATPGFGHVPIGYLMLLWCTRPRVAWFSVFLINFQAPQAMYFSVAASSLLAELVLQLISLYYMVLVASFAAKKGYYHEGKLDGLPWKNHALTMYAGALLWLIIIVFALGAMAWSAFNVNKIISEVGHEVVQVKLRNLGKAQNARKAARDARKSHNVAIELQRKIIARMNWLTNEAYENGEILVGPRPTGPLGAEYNSWHALLNNCSALATCWADIGQQVSQIPVDTNAELMYRKQQLGVKDLWAAQKRLASLRTSSEWQGPERYNNMRRAILAYSARYRGHLDTRLAASTARRNDAKQWLRSVPEAARPPVADHVQAPAEAQVQERKWKWKEMKANLWFRTKAKLLPSPKKDLHLGQSWNEAGKSWQHLVDAWEQVVQSWRDEMQILAQSTETTTAGPSSPRDEESGKRYILQSLRKQQVRNRLSSVPRIVFLGMVLCWIAQWCFWAGFIELAGDEFCPPRLSSIIGVWIGFSITGELYPRLH